MICANHLHVAWLGPRRGGEVRPPLMSRGTFTLAPAEIIFFEFRCFFLAYARRISLLDAVRTRPFWLKVGALNLQPYDAGSSPARVVFANNVFAEESWAATALAKTF